MKFKKILSSALSAVFLSGACFTNTLAYNVGDVIGKVLSTDIVTYIDGIRVPSFNIAGRTAVVAENLNACGVGYYVSYNEADRALSISPKGSKDNQRDFFHFDADTSSKPVGTPIMNVLYSDIKTYVDTQMVESFNIGGFTCIYTDELAKHCGTYSWDEASRTVNIFTEGKKILPNAVKTESSRTLSADESVITKSETFDRWASPAKSHLTLTPDGEYMAVEISEHINIETYDESFNLKNSFAIKKELPLFGGLYFGKDFNYIAFGQENLMCDNSREVIRIVIYDKNFVKISQVPISNCKTSVPFDASSGEMHEDERYLVLHTSRTQYPDENGSVPQTQLTVIIDKHTWQVSNILGKFQYNHTSHAFRELVRIDEGRLITANYSDAAPIRGAFLQELDFEGKIVHTQSIFNVGGPLGANSTGAMIGNLEVSPTGFLVPMSTIDHSIPTGYSNVNIDGIDRENRDIYLLWTDKNTWEQKHTCLARYTGVALTGSVPYIVKLGDGNFMVLWQQFSDYSEESETIRFAFIDKNGNQIGKTHSTTGRLSESCKPIEKNGKVVWYVNTEGGRDFYSLISDANAYETFEEEIVIPPVPSEKAEDVALPEDNEKEDIDKPVIIDGI